MVSRVELHLAVGGGFGAGAVGRPKRLDAREAAWAGGGGRGGFHTHLHTREGADDDYVYYFPEVGDKVKRFYTSCHAVCAKGDTVLETAGAGAAVEAAAAAAMAGGARSAGATCQVRYPHALGQLNDDGNCPDSALAVVLVAGAPCTCAMVFVVSCPGSQA